MPKAKKVFPGYILDFDKDALERFFDASKAGLNFLNAVANEESGVDAETVNLVTGGITQTLSTMLADVREDMKRAAIVNLDHADAREACQAVQAVERRAFNRVLGMGAAA